MGERRIPHLRDIFSLGGWGDGGGVQEDGENRTKQPRPAKASKQDKQEVKHLERHLSMKKTIRKKIMRELQQAWVEDPTEFKVEDVPREALRADLRLDSLSYGAGGRPNHRNNATFLEFLRGQGRAGEQEQESQPAPLEEDKQPFWKRLTRRNKR